MKKQLLFAIFFSLLILSGLLSLPSEFCVAGATAIVYIRADGSVDPSSTPIERVQDVYTFKGSVNASLVVQRDSIVIDGAGLTLGGVGNGTGVDLSGRNNVTVENLTIAMFYNGVYLSYSYNNTLLSNNITANTDYGIKSDRFNDCSGNVILNNSITGNGGGILLNPHSSYTHVYGNYVAANNGEGINLYATSHDLLSNNEVTANNGYGIHLDSHNTTLRNNRMTRNLYNFRVEAYYLDVFVSNDVDVSNTVDGKPVYYWANKHKVTVPSDAGYVALINCSDITVKGLNLTSNGEGILLYNTDNCTVTENNIANNDNSFWIDGTYGTTYSNHNTIIYNNMTHNSKFEIENSVFDTVSYNNITQNDWPTELTISGGTSNIVVRSNNVTNAYIDLLGLSNSDVSYNNLLGGHLTLTAVSNTTVLHNNITADDTGISLSYSSSNNVLSYNDIESSPLEGMSFSYSSSNNVISHNRIANSRLAALTFSFSSSNNVVSQNNITGNGYGVDLVYDSYNIFTHNSFINNTGAVDMSFEGANVWDSGYPSGGNFWSSYGGVDVHSGPYQSESCSDGLGDTAYVLDLYNVDHYPLMKPYGGPSDVGARVSVSRTVVPENYSRAISMNVTVINYGEQAEVYNFTCQFGAAVHVEEMLSLMERNSTAYAFRFNVSDWVKGNYTLHVQASPVANETDTTDNTYDGVLIVSIVGDIDGDGRVNIRDVSYAARRFGINPSSPLWNPNADLNDDAKIDIRDISTIAKHFGEHYP